MSHYSFSVKVWMRRCCISEGCRLAPQGHTVIKKIISHKSAWLQQILCKRAFFFPFTVARWKVTAAPIIHRVGFHNTGSTMLCSALCVTFAGKISLVFFSLSLCKIGKVTGKTKVFICAALWIWYSWIASVCTVQAGWTHWSELWRLLLLFYLIQLATACKRPVL